MRHISPMKSGAAVGSLVGLWHFLWVLLVGLGWAKSVMDLVLQLHFIQLQYALHPYATTTAVMLVVLTFSIGAMFGAMFAVVWNWLGSGENLRKPIRSHLETSRRQPETQLN